MSTASKRFTLSYANQHRPSSLFRAFPILLFKAMERFRTQSSLGREKGKFKFKNKLLSLNSSTITLCLSLFPWAEYKRAKGGVKAHTMLDHDDYMPSFVLLTEVKVADVTVAQGLALNPGSILILGRRYQCAMPCFASGPAKASSLSPASNLTPFYWPIKPYSSPAA
ncbi:hypothetical protein DFAR_710008 [Desulfarculales bacterium]